MANITNTSESASSSLMARALREAFYAGLVALGLFVLFVGLKTDQNILNELVLVQRWGLLAIFVAVAAVGRFLSVAFIRPYLAERKAAKAAAAPREESFIARNFSMIAIIALLIYPPVMVAIFGFQGSLKWVDNFGIQILIYVMLAWGLNIVVGLAGLLDLGYVAFMRSAPIPMRCCHPTSACRSGCCCRWPVFLRRSGAWFSASRSCA